jgi:Protein of unknown function (DUF3102)
MTSPAQPTIDLANSAKEINRLYALIKSADEEITDTTKSILTYRIEIGEMLNGVKDTDYGKHGKWQNWLQDNCPTIPLSTANLCMRLANNQDKLKE